MGRLAVYYKGMLYKAMKINKPQLRVRVDDFQM